MNTNQMKGFLMTASTRALTVAIGRLYLLQTTGERAVGATLERNGVGFSKKTENTGTYIGSWVFRGVSKDQMAIELNNLSNGLPSQCQLISDRFIEKARSIATVHARQLASLAATKKATAHIANDRKVIQCVTSNDLAKVIKEMDPFQDYANTL